jgi:hypothetical protein
MPPQRVEVVVGAAGQLKGVRVGGAEVKGVTKVAPEYAPGKFSVVVITVLASSFTEVRPEPEEA